MKLNRIMHFLDYFGLCSVMVFSCICCFGPKLGYALQGCSGNVLLIAALSNDAAAELNRMAQARATSASPAPSNSVNETDTSASPSEMNNA